MRFSLVGYLICRMGSFCILSSNVLSCYHSELADGPNISYYVVLVLLEFRKLYEVVLRFA